MANKPSYAAVTANESSPIKGKNDQPVDAPPPCECHSAFPHSRIASRMLVIEAATRDVSSECRSLADTIDSGPSGSQPPAPQAVRLPSPHPHPNHLESGPPAPGHGQVTTGWSAPPTPQVARSRAIRRFWMAFLYAWLIWVFVGYVIPALACNEGDADFQVCDRRRSLGCRERADRPSWTLGQAWRLAWGFCCVLVVQLRKQPADSVMDFLSDSP
jgi:hypothetical protein